MAVIENLDIVLGARTQKLDSGLDRSTRRVNRFESDIRRVNQSAERATEPIRNLGTTLVNLVPASAAAGNAFVAAVGAFSVTRAVREARELQATLAAAPTRNAVDVYLGRAAEVPTVTAPATNAVTRFTAAGVAAGATLAAAFVTTAAAAKAARITIDGVREQLTEIDEIAKAAAANNVTFSELAGFRLSVGETSGLGVAAADKALQKLQIRLAEAERNGGALDELLTSMGLNAGQLLEAGPLEALRQIADATQDIADPTKQLVLAKSLFEEEGTNLVLTLRAGRDAIDEAITSGEQLGLTLTEAQARQVEAANDAWGRVEVLATGAFRQIAVEVAPLISTIAQEITGLESPIESVSTLTRIWVDSLTVGAGIAADMLALLEAQGKVVQAIFTADIELIQAASKQAQEALQFQTGNEFLSKLFEARDAAREAAETPSGAIDARDTVAADAAIQADEEAKNAADALARARDDERRAAEQQQETINDRLQSLRDEIIEMERGADAVARLRLVRAGATEAQLRDFDTLIARRNALRAAEEQQRDAELASKRTPAAAPSFGALQKGSVEAFSAGLRNENAAQGTALQVEANTLLAQIEGGLQQLGTQLARLTTIGKAGP